LRHLHAFHERLDLPGRSPVAQVSTAIANGHRQSNVDELLPWNYPVFCSKCNQ